jgi:uncharacterized protein YndB with AHSA1/START domain
MDINRSAPAVAVREVVIQAPVDIVWNLIVEIDRWPDWNPAVKSARLNGLLEAGTQFTWKSGGISIVSTLRELKPMTRIVWTGKAIGTRAIHVWSFETIPSGVVVSTSESLEGWLVSLMRKSMQAALGKSLVAWLNELKRRAEKS